MRNTKKKKLTLKRLSIAKITNTDQIKGMSGGICEDAISHNKCGTRPKSYPPYICRDDS